MRKGPCFQGKFKDISSHTPNKVVNCGPWERLVKNRLNSVSTSELLVFLPVLFLLQCLLLRWGQLYPSSCSGQKPRSHSGLLLHLQSRLFFWPSPLKALWLQLPSSFIQIIANSQIWSLCFYLTPTHTTPQQSSLNTTARVILIKEKHITSFLCSKLWWFPSHSGQEPKSKFQEPSRSVPLRLPLPPLTPPLPLTHPAPLSACSSSNTPDTFQP